MRLHSARLLATLTLVAAFVTLALAAQTTAPSSLLTIAATAALGIALAAVAARVTAVAPARGIHVGHRGARDRESLASQTAPSHPNTAGRPRPRAPGSPLPAA